LGSSKFLFKHELSTENFVTVEIRAAIPSPCGYFDTGENYYDEEECDEEEYEIYLTRASAAAVSSSEGKTYILTANHFCDVTPVLFQIPDEFKDIVTIEKTIYKDSQSYSFKVVKQSRSLDLCLISSDYPIENEIELADEMPEVGELTTTISSPLGISETGVSLHFSGTFSGCNGRTCFFTIPAIAGSSGSLVLNYEKEVVGITQKSLTGFPEVTIGVGIEEIREFLLEYESESGIDIIH
jgi:S1-C subfamily serine protease